MELVSVAALADNRVIADGDRIPWGRLPADREQYRARVAEDPVVLGRRTFDAMGADPAGRVQVVLSRTEREYDRETTHHAGGIEAALELATELGDDTVYVLGGGEVYRGFQPRLDRMVLSHVHGEYSGDTYYPEWGEEWVVVSERAHERFTLREWVRA